VKDHDNQKKNMPIVKFIDCNNQTYTFVSKELYNNKSNLGMKLKIYYLRDFPEYAEIDSFLSNWGVVLFFLIFTIFFLVSSIVTLYK